MPALAMAIRVRARRPSYSARLKSSLGAVMGILLSPADNIAATGHHGPAIVARHAVRSMTADPVDDPLLRPFQLRHLTLRNRLMSTAHEPSFSEDGMPKDRYRLYHVEKAKGGIALTMTAGSAVVSPNGRRCSATCSPTRMRS